MTFSGVVPVTRTVNNHCVEIKGVPPIILIKVELFLLNSDKV